MNNCTRFTISDRRVTGTIPCSFSGSYFYFGCLIEKKVYMLWCLKKHIFFSHCHCSTSIHPLSVSVSLRPVCSNWSAHTGLSRQRPPCLHINSHQHFCCFCNHGIAGSMAESGEQVQEYVIPGPALLKKKKNMGLLRPTTHNCNVHRAASWSLFHITVICDILVFYSGGHILFRTLSMLVYVDRYAFFCSVSFSPSSLHEGWCCFTNSVFKSMFCGNLLSLLISPVTSTKAVVVSPMLVGCLSAGLHKKYLTDLHETWI